MPLRTICVYLGAFLGASWPVLGPSWAILGRSWAILGPSWGYLGLLGAILSYLGAILETRVFKRAPAGSACCGPSPRCAQVSNWTRSVSYCGNFGVHSGAQNWVILALFWSYFLDHLFDDFRTTLGVILGTNLGPDLTKKVSKWDQEGHWELQRPKILHLQKPYKPYVFGVFGVQRPRKRALGSPRRLPKRHPKSSKA